MGNGDNFALDWIRGELESTLNQARAALESYAEGGREETRLRSCLTSLHQVHGTLRMLELEGVVLLADHMEQTAQSLLNGSIQDARMAEQVLMQSILQLPVFIEQVQGGSLDDLPLVMPCVNELRECCGLAPMQLKPPVSVGFSDADAAAAIERFNAIDGAAKTKRVRGAYQQVLLGVVKGQSNAQSVETLSKIAVGLERICEGSPLATLWQALHFFAKGYANEPLKLSTEAIRDLRRVDAEMKRLVAGGADALVAPLPVELIGDLLRGAETRGQRDPAISELRSAIAVPKAAAPVPREALEQAAMVLREELSTVRDSLDLYVRASERTLADLLTLTVPLDAIAATFGMLDEVSPQKLLTAQRQRILALTSDADVDDDLLLGVAGALIRVDEMLADKTGDGASSGVASVINEAQMAVLQEARGGIEAVKQNIVDYVSGSWETAHLQTAPDVLAAVVGALSMVPLPRPSALLTQCSAYIKDYLLCDYEPQWSEMDAFADALGGVDYYLERLYENSRTPHEDALDLVERSLALLTASAPPAQSVETPGTESQAPVVLEDLPAVEDEEALPYDTDDDISLFGDEDDLFVDEPAEEAQAAEAETVEAPVEGRDELDLMLGASPEELTFDDTEALEPEAEPEAEPKSEPESEIDSAAIAAADDNTVTPVKPVAQLTGESTLPHLREVDQLDLVDLDDFDLLDHQPADEMSGAGVAAAETALATEGGDVATVEIDEELLEIFIEEVEEVLDTMNTARPRWGADHNDNEAMVEIRRGFHTLKGSGRIVGANQIGDVAWAIENMLNRVMDGTLEVNSDHLQLVASACALMPTLQERFAARQVEILPQSLELIEQADVVASGGSLGAHLASSAESVEEELDEEEFPIWDGPEAEAPHAPAIDMPSFLDAAEVEASPFVEEAQGHIDLLHATLKQAQDDGVVILEEPFTRALHTIAGSAATAGAAGLVCIAEPVQEVVSAVLRECGGCLEGEYFAFVQGAVSAMQRALKSDAPADLETAEVFRTESERLLESLQSAGEVQALLDSTSAATLVSAREFLDAWHTGALDLVRAEEIQDALDELARLSPLADLTELAVALHSAHVGVADGRLSDLAHLELVAGHDGLLLFLDALAADQPTPPLDEFVTRLTLLLQEPAVEELDLNDLDIELEPEVQPESASADDAPGEVEAIPEAPVEAVTWQSLGTVIPDASVPEHSTDAQVGPVGKVGKVGQADDVDDDLLELFFEEAEEILESMDSALQDWGAKRGQPVYLETLLRDLHTLKGGARLTGLARLGDMAHDFESQLVEFQGAETISDVQFSAIHARYDELVSLVSGLRSGDVAAATSTPAGDVEASVTTEPAAVETAPDAEQAAQYAREEAALQASLETLDANDDERGRSNAEMVRVSATLLEALVNLAGESSIVRARVEQGISDFGGALEEMEITIERMREQLRRLEMETEAQVVFRNERTEGPRYEEFDALEMDRYSQLQQLTRSLTESATDMLDLKETLRYRSRESETLLLQQARLNTELQEGLMRTRMVPFSRLMPRLRRIVRQVSRDLDKQVDFHAYNAEGELDRNVLERMVPALEHMLRNAIDHGIEATHLRHNFGKPSAGRVNLRLSREGGDVVIEISDDGAGIDVETVRAKAVERGLMERNADLTDAEVLEFVLAAGFSTAKAVTQISGRGVGMDVVHSEVKQLGGSITIESVPGQGTTFTVRLPFTVSVNRALMVSLGDDSYAIPLNTIEGIVLLSADDLNKYYGARALPFEYAGVPYGVRYLGNYLGREYVPRGDRSTVPVVLVRSGEQAVAIHVDGVQGSREIVVKSLGPQFAGVGGISGATILGDGSVVIILDLLALIRTQGIGSSVEIRTPTTAEEEPCWVLVVDDSVTVRKVTSRLLERQGMNVMIAKDGVEAIAVLQERCPDIVLLDIEMPRMDGFEVARQMRRDERLADLPIIMISSRSGNKHTERARELGVNQFLSKPFQENELLETIEQLVTR